MTRLLIVLTHKCRTRYSVQSRPVDAFPYVHEAGPFNTIETARRAAVRLAVENDWKIQAWPGSGHEYEEIVASYEHAIEADMVDEAFSLEAEDLPADDLVVPDMSEFIDEPPIDDRSRAW